MKVPGVDSSDRPKIVFKLTATKYAILKIVLSYLYSDFVMDESDWSLLSHDDLGELLHTAGKLNIMRYMIARLG